VPSDDVDRDDQSAQTAWDDLPPFAPPGYVPMGPDSWTGDAADDDERYRGRRRADDATPRWRWVAIGLGLLALIGVGAMLVRPGPADDAAQPATTPSVKLPSDTASPTQTSAAPTAQPSTPGPTPTAKPIVSAAFSTITVEAEAGPPTVSLIGSAQVTTYKGASGGRIVEDIGNWGAGQPPGALRINGVTIPTAGRYQIAIYYTNAKSPGNRDAVVSGTGAQPVTLTFSGGRNCCGVRTVVTTLSAGTYSITIANPTGMGPSIDKVVITAA
jgi:hypothetical protein